MSDRPEDYTDPENSGPSGPSGPAAPDQPTVPSAPDGPSGADVPWWQGQQPGPSTWPDAGPSAAGGYWAGSGQPGSGGGPAPAGEPQGGYAPQGAGNPQGGQPQVGGHPQGPQVPYGYGPGGPAGPGDWHGGQWAGGQWIGGQWGWAPSGGGWGPQVQPPSPGGKRRSKGFAAAVAVGLTALALLIGVGIGYGVWNGGSSTPSSGQFVAPGGTSKLTFTTTSPRASEGTATGTKVSAATGAPTDIATIRAKVAPGLVDINTVLKYDREDAAGTGMVLTSTGKVLTNNHVIEGATTISVTDLGNGKTYSASVLGYTRTDDIAVIQLKHASGLKTVQIGNSSSVKVGEAIVGIGNAGGTGGEPSAAGGAVTALDQSITASDEGSLGTTIEHLTGLIQSNADIIPGDSGGPLVTTSGLVVGMDTAASEEEGYSIRGAVTGQGYSIPIDEAVSTAHQIIAGKAVSSLHIGGTAFLGIYVASGTRSSGYGGYGGFGFGFGDTVTTTAGTSTAPNGAEVEEVIPGTPAQGAGLTQGDVITSVGGSSVTSSTGLMKAMLEYHPGDAVKVVWTTTSGQTESATVTFASGPPD